MDAASPPASPNKRKRDSQPTAELEIDVDAPEPPSKKALRRAKKGKPAVPRPSSPPPRSRSKGDETEKHAHPKSNGSDSEEHATSATKPAGEAARPRSEYGVWIGNLPWTTDKTVLRKYLVERGSIADSAITRIHMPAPSKAAGAAPQRANPVRNKGFAYVDLDTAEAQRQAIALSETLLGGRSLLIKDSNNFAGRPAVTSTNGSTDASKKRAGHPPNKRVFVGNLDFETDREELRTHFEQCGDVEQIFVATFEDSGNCKGYAWVTFGELEAAEKAVRGWIADEEDGNGLENDEVAEGSHDMRKDGRKKVHKRWINVFMDRRMRVEFAEDATVRYQKRFGKSENKDEGE